PADPAKVMKGNCKLQIANCKLQNEGNSSSRWPRIIRLFAICILQFAFCNLQLSSSAAGAQESSTPFFDLYTAEGISALGPLEQLREDWSVSLGGKKAIQVSGSDLVSLRQAKTPL